MSAEQQPRRYLMIVNPLAHNCAKDYQTRVTNRLTAQGYEFDIWYTTGDPQFNHEYLVKRVSRYTDWVVLGGDGSVNLAANVLAGTGVCLGIIPCGSGNDFARQLYADQDDPVTIALGHHKKLIDLGRCNKRFFINVLGVGFDGEVVASTRNQPPSMFRRWRYLVSAIKLLCVYREQPISLYSPSKSKDQSTFMVAFGNGQYFGGGMQIAPKAQWQDGVLDCCWIGKTSFLLKCYYLLRIFSGAHIHCKSVDYWQDKLFTITTKGLPIEADGEYIGMTPATIRCAAKALWLRMPVESNSDAP